ncbi:uncharacterized protein LOC106155662 isoform X3 [Lingula anatina]|uniref:Voltage-gated hydrogen channel 1 n=1 Tax=Lingula anatina TaxID=7574 RepID=A0A1S3HIX7_LINAN|nr:uncharacterized protein LOC106155662 isoform X3 [Lingula anatina]|eukprot:XP_013386068.1 uncharacterized protein LOC106155662 isoform X3 [Lingula anatina]
MASLLWRNPSAANCNVKKKKKYQGYICLSSQFSFLRHKSFEQELEDDNIDDDILQTEIEAQAQAEKSCHEKLVEVLESNPIQVAICILVLIDAVLMVSLLMLDVHIVQAKCNANQEDISKLIDAIDSRMPGALAHVHGADVTLSDIINSLHGETNSSHGSSSHSVHKRDLSSVAHLLDAVQEGAETVMGSSSSEGGIFLRRLLYKEETQGDNDSTLEVHVSSDKLAANESHSKDAHGDGHGGHSLIENVAHALHISSIVILGIFLVEVILKCYALRLSYFRKKMELVDGIIIIISFTVDVIFYDGLGGRSGVDAASLLIFFLMWRMLRVFNGFLVTSRKRLKFRLTLQMRARKRAEAKISDLDVRIGFMEKELDSLRSLASKYGAKNHEVLNCKPKASVHKNVTAKEGISSMLCASMSMMHHFASKENVAKNEQMAQITESEEVIEDDNSNRINPFMLSPLKGKASQMNTKDSKENETTVTGSVKPDPVDTNISSPSGQTKEASALNDVKIDMEDHRENDADIVANPNGKNECSATDDKISSPAPPQPSPQAQKSKTQDLNERNGTLPSQQSTRSRGALKRTSSVDDQNMSSCDDQGTLPTSGEPTPAHPPGEVDGSENLQQKSDTQTPSDCNKLNNVAAKNATILTNGDVISNGM